METKTLSHKSNNVKIEIYNKNVKYIIYIQICNKYVINMYHKYEIYNKNKTWHSMNIKHKIKISTSVTCQQLQMSSQSKH